MNSQKNSKDKKKKSNGPFYNLAYDFVKFTGAIPVLLWLRPKIYRPYGTKTPKGGVLVSANHRSLLDPIIVHTVFPARRMHCLATKDLFNTKLKNAFFNKMHCIMVDKENFTLSAFHDVVTRLDAGKLVVIFPEGGLNRDEEDTIHTFKSGAVLMAHRAKAPILPIYIFKKEKWYQRQRIVIGDPFDVRAAIGNLPTLEQLNMASEKLREEEIKLQKYFESLPIYKKLTKKQNIESESKIEGNVKYEQKI